MTAPGCQEVELFNDGINNTFRERNCGTYKLTYIVIVTYVTDCEKLKSRAPYSTESQNRLLLPSSAMMEAVDY